MTPIAEPIHDFRTASPELDTNDIFFKKLARLATLARLSCEPQLRGVVCLRRRGSCGSQYGTLGSGDNGSVDHASAQGLHVSSMPQPHHRPYRYCTVNHCSLLSARSLCLSMSACRGLLPMLLPLMCTPHLGIIVHRLTSICLPKI
jgi:hypothetical protein